ncbi:SusC/RagA family TonB-linked outer membrane protein [Echinicola vietnamensis]|uniref:TonB-linked outer membrane protein, SusC/RagA family n=1 Tax=Echinicola vietnamensis (strain DSM 17526 / LMG 23754 / KMM 6221) TaxID=926556 RepID=L0FZL1_ECHVK|nr:TonB-dependent receptor [Echinicola vietnamensis]AGA78742.1 TonB-linked outer membrane protein, SusC/RagA family [Echinicola vietnamensis DSM 17526]
MIKLLRISKESWKPKAPFLGKLSVMMVVLVLWAFANTAMAQETEVTGKVLDPSGAPVPGVNILEQGTSNGTVTDLDGLYSLTVSSPEATLKFSFIGFEPQTVPLNGQTQLDITMQEELTGLEEVVVIGYGAQKEKEMTSAITTLKTEDLVKTPSSNAMQSLQGKVAGVQIVSKGAPGASPTVRVRGIGSFEGGGAPLYVVDGMFFDNIDFLNSNDIKSLSVLKDASASAIYGARASNGVVLIETNSGEYEQEAKIEYDGYYGIQNPQNILKMANSQQFVQYVNETGSAADMAFVNNAMQAYGRSRIDPSIPAVNTDWYDEIMSTAPIQNHTLTFSGGSAKTRYSIGGSYFSQEGLLNETRNEYERVNIRANVDSKVKDWITVGGNFTFSTAKQYVGSDAAWFNAYFAVPILPKYDEDFGASPIPLSNAQRLGYRGRQNPFYPLQYNDSRNKVNKINGNLHAELTFIPDKLTFRTAYNYKLDMINARNVNFTYNDGVLNPLSSMSRTNSLYFDQIIDNYITYKEYFGDHGLTATLGQSFRSETFERLNGSRNDLDPNPTFENEELWYLNNGQANDINAATDDGSRIFYLSYFGRLAYNYKEKYLLYATYRRDNYNKFQVDSEDFLTFAAGWVATEEEFFDVKGIDFLKFRASWGQLGNDGIDPSVGQPTLEGTTTAINNVRVPGFRLNPTYDLINQVETTEETNFGITAKFFQNRLSLDADYYIRNTESLAVTVLQPLFRGSVRRSVGEIQNKGLEVSLNWENQVTEDFSYFIGGNFATLQNSVKDLGGPSYLNAGSAEFRQRSIIGQPYEAFYGYEVAGVFQNEADIANSGYSEQFLADNDLVPGDFMFKDQNGDGVIDDLDRVVLGSYLPELTYGGNLGFRYKNLDFSVLIQGQSGHSILNRKRGEVIFTNDTNIDAELATNLWRGEGTSNRYPSAAGLRKGWNQNFSDYFVEDGSFFRIQNVRMSYSLLDKEVLGLMMPETRITLTAERPLTIFNYNGFNPEVDNGIDRQVYPIPAVYTVGLNLKF